MDFAPLISVIIPVYNGANYMRECIDSALSQTYVNKEVIVINDGSRDNGRTLEIAQSYGDKIRLIDKPNGGVASALNAGIAAARGDYLSWLSHDDVYPADKLDRQVRFLAGLDEKAVIVFGDYSLIDEKSQPMGEVSTAHMDTERMLFELYAKQSVHGCSLLIPAEVFRKVGNFREDLPTTQDYDLWMRVAGQYRFAYLPGIAVHSRQHAEQGSRTLNHFHEALDYYRRHFAQLSPAWMDKHYAPYDLQQKYLLLLRKFSSRLYWPAAIMVLKQALPHLSRYGWKLPLVFTLKSLYFFTTGNIMNLLKKILPLPIKNFIRRRLNSPALGRRMPSSLDFTKIYRNNIFGSSESRSGSGSTMEQTAYIRSVFPGFFRELGVKSILDVPCGDFNWIKHVDLAGIHYIGGDIVEDLVRSNNEKYQSPEREFRRLNIITDDLPKVDLILCRDCLVHLKFEDGLKAIQNFKRSGSTYLLATTFTNRPANEELFGIWRTLNLQKAPYNLPEPLQIINERCTEGDNQFTDKCLGLWRLSDIA